MFSIFKKLELEASIVKVSQFFLHLKAHSQVWENFLQL